MRVLVTGGGGFVGGAVARALCARGDEVVSFARGDYPVLRALGIETVRGDLGVRDDVVGAARGCDAVVHVAALAGIAGRPVDFARSNVLGTANVLAACRLAGIARLVLTSTPSVVHTGGDIEGGDESLPYATSFDAPYPRTKAVAERMVLGANGQGLATVALRPHLVWGPEDPQLTAKVLSRARAGRLRLVGSGDSLIDTTYVDDAVRAHLLALDAVWPGAACAGKAYFISSGDPQPVHVVLAGILSAAGLAPERRSVPVGVAVAAGAVAEAVWTGLRLTGDPPMTRFLAHQLATAHWFDLGAARKDLGFVPEVTVAEGVERLRASLSPAC